MKIHIVKAGETLYTLAKKYGLELAKLLAANPDIADPDNVAVGQKVKIPLPPKASVQPVGPVKHVHKVVQGDTLWKLAKQWNVPLADLIKANPHLKNPSVLMTGDTVFIPETKTAPVASAGGSPAGAGGSAADGDDGAVGHPVQQEGQSPPHPVEVCPPADAGQEAGVWPPAAGDAVPGVWPWHASVPVEPWSWPWPQQPSWPYVWPWTPVYGAWNDWGDSVSPWDPVCSYTEQTGCGCGGFHPAAAVGLLYGGMPGFDSAWPGLYGAGWTYAPAPGSRTGPAESRAEGRSAEAGATLGGGREGEPDRGGGTARLAVIGDGPKKRKTASSKPRRDRAFDPGPASSRPWINL